MTEPQRLAELAKVQAERRRLLGQIRRTNDEIRKLKAAAKA